MQAAKGLEAAHKKGIVHRDIKPANLLLDTEGTVKILDMGLARLGGVGDDAPQADLTSTGTIMGTVDYMAPEQALDTKTADARADIYALGCSLHYLLTGKATYDGDTIMKKLLAHRDQPIPSLRAGRPEVPEQLEIIHRKMLAKRVEDRFLTMSELIADLERLEFGQEAQEATVIIQQTASIPPSTNTTTDNSAFEFLQNLPVTPTIQKTKAKPKATPASQGKAGQPPWKNIKVLIGAGLLGILLLAGIIVFLDTKDGKLIVEVDQKDAMVQVLDSEGKIEISQKGVDGKITISVDPGKHRLKVVKDGFTTFGLEFEMEKNGTKEITARLEPLENKPAMVGTKPVPVTPMTPLVAGEKKPLAFQMPGFDEWVKQVAAMPAEKQVEAVSKKLVELNPGFDGKVTPTIENSVVTGLVFLSDNVTDISPVRGMTGLNVLSCQGSDQRKGKLSDLTPLKGMALIHFDCLFTSVNDLSPLAGMPLTFLECSGTQVSDLSPLHGMKLKTFSCANSQVHDVTPLSGMPLDYLQLSETRISSLSPLKGMPLNGLRFYRTPVTDLSPLKDMPLKMLHFDFIPQRDTELVRSIKTLETINRKPAAEFWKEVEGMPVEKPLAFQMPGFDEWVKQVAAMPAEQQVEAVSKKLVELNPGFDGKVTPVIASGAVASLQFITDKVTDISPVQVLTKLKYLDCSGSGHKQGALADLTPLKGMKMTNLNFSMTKVSDLIPLNEMPLIAVIFGESLVADLSPLMGMELENLECQGTLVSDLSVLKTMPLKSIDCDFKPDRDLEIIRSLKTLETINRKPAAEFWKEVEGMPVKTPLAFQTPGFDEWVKQIQAMPAEQQVVAVSKKLMELNPGFDGKVTDGQGNGTPKIESGVVREFGFLTDKISDISPVRAFSGLQGLNCGVTDGRSGADGILADLSPLKGIQLTSFNCMANHQIDDISPLTGMPLTSLRLSWSAVSNLTSLKGMPLRALFIGGMPITDLTPLERMDLQQLDISFSKQISDLSPLKSLRLNTIGLESTSVSDLSPLSGQPLTMVNCRNTQVSDFSLLKEMPLTHLNCDFKPERDTELLRSIKSLEKINDKPAAEFWKEVEAKTMPAASVDPDRRAAEWVLSKEGEVKVAEQGKAAVYIHPGEPLPATPFRVQMIVFGGSEKSADDSELACLKDLTDLKELNFTSLRGYTNAGMTHLSGLTNLTKLVIFNNNQISDVGIQHLAGLKKLEELHIAATQVSEKGLRVFLGCPLQHISIGGRPAADKMLPVVQEFKALTSLDLHGTVINDGEVHRLLSLPNLEHLSFMGTGITDEGLKTVATMKIRSFDVINGEISDTGLKHLEVMTSLTRMALFGTKVTSAGVTTLQKALPDCKIIWDDPTKAQ